MSNQKINVKGKEVKKASYEQTHQKAANKVIQKLQVLVGRKKK